MADRASWQSKYYIEQNPAASLATLTNKPDFTTNDIGVEGTGGSDDGTYVLLLENKPSLVPFPNIINETELTTGRSDRHTVEYEATVHEASPVTLEGNANSYIMSLYLWSLFQKGASEGGNGTQIITYTPYTDPTPEMYFSLVKLMSALTSNMTADTQSHYKTGCIVKSLTLTAEERGLVKYSAEVLGAVDGVANTDLGIGSAWSTLGYPAQNTSWKWQDFTTKFDTTTVAVKALNLTFNNNVEPVYYGDTDNVSGYRLQRCTVEGTLDLPWGTTTKGANIALELYKSGTDFTLEFYTTNGATAANSVDIALNVIADDFDMSDDPEIASVLTFHGVYDGTNAAMDVKVGYTKTVLDRSIP